MILLSHVARSFVLSWFKAFQIWKTVNQKSKFRSTATKQNPVSHQALRWHTIQREVPQVQVLTVDATSSSTLSSSSRCFPAPPLLSPLSSLFRPVKDICALLIDPDDLACNLHRKPPKSKYWSNIGRIGMSSTLPFITNKRMSGCVLTIDERYKCLA